MKFPTTLWDELAKASLHGDTEARSALGEFCRRYWQPVNAVIRWKGYPEADVADLTQDFFLHFLENHSWRRADRLRGSFRTFLLGALTHRLQKAQAHLQRLKRGGGAQPVSLDALEEEAAEAPASLQTPPTDTAHFDREWALRVLETALEVLRTDYRERGKEALYTALKGYLTVRRAPPTYDDAARQLDMHPDAVKTEIHRLRQAFRAALRREIGITVSAPHEVDEEMRHLRAVLAAQLDAVDELDET